MTNRGFVAAPPSTDHVPWWIVTIALVVLFAVIICQLVKGAVHACSA